MASVVPVRTKQFLLNPDRRGYRPQDRALIGCIHARQALPILRSLSGFAPTPTPLTPAPRLAHALGVASVFVKDESGRFGLGSFKGLGGAYAVASMAEAEHRSAPSGVRQIFVCASAGNHGLSVAAGARAAGCRAQIWLSAAVSVAFETRLLELGAEVERTDGGYEESLAAAVKATAVSGGVLVADTSWEGYTQAPLQVMRGYTVLAQESAEAIEARGGPASHVFVQAGVGGLAGAMAGYLRDRWGEQVRIVVVEPVAAACLFASAAAGIRTAAPAGPRTRLGRLDCRLPSLVAWQLVGPLADAFVTITDDQATQAAELLAAEGFALSPCGAAGAAGLIATMSPAERAALRLDAHSRVLLVGTETVDSE